MAGKNRIHQTELNLGQKKSHAIIKVIGVGGGGGNAVNRMIEVGLQGVDFIAMNTDAQVLDVSDADIKIQLGQNVARGLGVGGDPTAGRSAAEESRSEIVEYLDGADLVFITAGMGGGTGTGAAPVIAEIAKDCGALVVAVVTKPFKFEGPRRARIAADGAANLREKVDTMIQINNDRLVDISERTTTLIDAFKAADDVLRSGVQSISDIIQVAGNINVDFADVRAIIQRAGTALMGIGKGTGENRARQAAEAAVSSHLLDSSIRGATRILVNVTSSRDLTVHELGECMDYVYQLADQDDANIIMGHVFDENMIDMVQVTVLATGFPTGAPLPEPVVEVAAPEPFVATETRRRGTAEVAIEEPSPAAPPKEDRELPAFLRRQRL